MKTLVALALMLASATAAAQINKCMDKGGKVVGYGTECPAGTRSEPSGVKSSPAPSSGAPAAASQPKSTAEKDADFRKRQMEKQEAEAKSQKKGAEAERRSQTCEQAQAYMKGLQAGNRITRTDPKTGERIYLDDKDYPGEMARTQRVISESCK